MTGGDTSHYTIEDVCMVTIRYSTTLCEYSERRHPIQIAQMHLVCHACISVENSYQCDSRLSTCRILVWDVWSKKKKVSKWRRHRSHKSSGQKKKKKTLCGSFFFAPTPRCGFGALPTGSPLCPNQCLSHSWQHRCCARIDVFWINLASFFFLRPKMHKFSENSNTNIRK